MEKERVVILGATPFPSRFAYIATLRLAEYGHEVFPVGIKPGKIGDHEVLLGQPELEDIDTITLYLSAKNQKAHYEWLLGLEPERIIFNPGTANPELEKMAREAGIEVVPACTLVMLGTSQY